ncbi:CMF_collapsed_G0029150.mRNA.1.CDS.1 [Saccharomyces cerevisiae]|nr:CMF_HP1_G0027750.mRNA.1.CDS.1 [Saccharomyces cerevisiae]CAI7356129.1 CMF_collapsed_G0029150.mRNA.1.CDS.1 [Saccharomyces cerevisiae]
MTYPHECYSIPLSTYPTLTFHSTPWPILTKSVQMHSHHYARHLPQRSIPCVIYP